MAVNPFAWARPNLNYGGGGGHTPYHYGGGGGYAPPNYYYGGGGGPGGLDPGYAGPTGQANIQDLFSSYLSGGLNTPAKYGDEGFRNMMEGFQNYFATPMFNQYLADRTQGYNEFADARNFTEQQQINDFNELMARQASGREDRALDFGMRTNQRDFTEGQRQFNATNANERFGLDTNRMDVQNRLALGQGQLSNDRRGQDINRELGLAGINQDRYDTDARTRVDMRGHDITRELGLGSLANDKARIGNDRFANETGRMDVQNRMTLGQGQLGFQNRELDVNDAFRRQQLAQDADLSRERMKNDLTQTRYQTFGRSAAPNFRAAMSWY